MNDDIALSLWSSQTTSGTYVLGSGGVEIAHGLRGTHARYLVEQHKAIAMLLPLAERLARDQNDGAALSSITALRGRLIAALATDQENAPLPPRSRGPGR